MGVKILKREYKNQFFPSNKSVNWLLGNVGDWQRLELYFEAEVIFEGTENETVSIDNVKKTIRLNNGKSWQNYGFDLGDRCNIKYTINKDSTNSGNYTKENKSGTFDILNIYGDTIEITNFDFGDYSIMPTDRGTVKITDFSIKSAKDPEGIAFRYTHLTNDDYQSGTLNSIIDGSKTEFTFAGLQNLQNGIVGKMIPSAIQSGMAIDNCKIQKINSLDSGLFAANFNSGNYKVRLITERFGIALGSNISSSVLRLNLLNQIGDEFKSVDSSYIQVSNRLTEFGEYSNINTTQCFFVSKENRTVNFNLDFRFKVSETNDNSSTDALSLVVLRYSRTNGFIDKKVLKKYDNASSLINKTLIYDDSFEKYVSQGERLVLGLEYYHKAEATKRFVDIDVLFTELSVLNNNNNVNSNLYKLTADFMIGGFFENVSDIKNKTIPPFLENSGSLTDNFEILVYPEWNNPNTVIKNDLKHTERLGNTGWFNENFNGLKNDYKVKSFIYKDIEGNVVNSIDYGRETIFECVIESEKQILNDSKFGFGFALLPYDTELYKNKKTPYHSNLIVNTGKKYSEGCFALNESNGGYIFEGDSFDDSVKMQISDYNSPIFSRVSANEIKLTLRFIPKEGFFNFFENNENREYFIFVSIGADNENINFSDRVALLIDSNNMENRIPSLGRLQGLNTVFLEHPRDERAKGVKMYYGHIEDDLLTKTDFSFEKNKKIIGFNLGYEIINKETESIFRLLNYPINTSAFPVDKNGIQEIKFEATRGYKMHESNNKNLVKIEMNSDFNEGNKIGYSVFFAQKIRWEDWIYKNEVPEEFFNNNKLNNGYNNNWLDYVRNGENYSLNFFIEIIFLEGDQVLQYKNNSEIKINGYDENSNIEKSHIYKDFESGNILNENERSGLILNDKKTLLEITYKKIEGNFDFGKTYSTISIEVEKGSGEKDIRTLSSVFISESGNPLESLDESGLLKMELISENEIKTSCLINPLFLPENDFNYKITGRIGCFPEGDKDPETDDFGIYDKYYENAFE